MISSASDNSENSTGSRPIRLESGSRDLVSEQRLASLQPKPLAKVSSKEVQAHNLGPTTTSGTESKPLPFSTVCGIRGPFVIQTNGCIGQEILDSDGQTIAWTTNVIVAQVIVEMLSDITITKD